MAMPDKRVIINNIHGKQWEWSIPESQMDMLVVILDEMGARKKESDPCPNCESPPYSGKATKIVKDAGQILCAYCGRNISPIIPQPVAHGGIGDKGHCSMCGKHRGFVIKG